MADWKLHSVLEDDLVLLKLGYMHQIHCVAFVALQEIYAVLVLQEIRYLEVDGLDQSLLPVYIQLALVTLHIIYLRIRYGIDSLLIDDCKILLLGEAELMESLGQCLFTCPIFRGLDNTYVGVE